MFNKPAKHKDKNALLLGKRIKDLVDDGDISLFSLPSIAKGLNIYHLNTEPYTHPDVRGYWLHGPPGTGKTTYAREHYGLDIYIKP